MAKPQSVDEYLANLAPDRVEAMSTLMQTIRETLPIGFEERLNYGMPSWVVPHATYPAGYHVDPSLPLPFISVASQKRHIGLYHMGVYASPPLLEWFVAAYPQHVKTKLNMGKSCIRFTNIKTIPFALIGELCTKMSPEAWIEIYEGQVKLA